MESCEYLRNKQAEHTKNQTIHQLFFFFLIHIHNPNNTDNFSEKSHWGMTWLDSELLLLKGLDWWTELVGRVSQLESDFIHIIKHFVKKVLLYLPCSVQAIHTLMIHHCFLSHQNV